MVSFSSYFYLPIGFNKIIKENYRGNLTTTLQVKYTTETRNLKKRQAWLYFPGFLFVR